MTIPKITLIAKTTLIEGATGSYLITLDSPAPVGGLSVNFNTIGSTATLNTDYIFTTGTNLVAVTNNNFIISEGQTSATLNVTAINDVVNDPNETVILSLATGEGYLLENTPPTFAPKTDYSVGIAPYSVMSGDFNGDGKLDVLTANFESQNISLLLGNGQGGFAAQQFFVVWNAPTFICLGDVNRDGRLDILTTDINTDGISLLLGDGKGSFAAYKTFAAGSYSESVNLGDVNGDGNIDMLTANSYKDNVSVLLGDGQGSFATQQVFTVGDAPIFATLGDVNGDGKLDIVSANTQSDNVSVLLGDGQGGFATQQVFTVGNEPVSVNLGDINGDNKLDITTANVSSNNISVLLGDGQGGFATQQNFAVGIYPFSSNLVDINGDGKLDVLTANGASGSISVLLGNGQGGFATQQTFTVGIGPVSIDSNDVNNDGKLDIVTANLIDNTVSVLLNTTILNTAFPSSATLTITDVAPTPTGIIFNGDKFYIPKPDSLVGGKGDDSLYGFLLNDTLEGGAGKDSLEGGYGDDYLDGGTGADTMKGGQGSDTYVVDNKGDIVTEDANTFLDVLSNIRDTVNSSLSTYTLPADVEKLVLINKAVSGQGNDLSNTITGNDLANTLQGLAGDDFLIGGLGNDVLEGGFGNDTLQGESDIDVARYKGSISDFKFELENSQLKITDINLTNGNEGSDLLTGIEKLQFKDTSFTLERSNPVTTVLPTNEYLKALTWGGKWDSNIITYAFDSHDDTYSWGGTDANQATAKEAIIKALHLYENVIPVRFIPVADASLATFKFDLVTWDWEKKLDPENSYLASMNFPKTTTAIEWYKESGVMQLINPTTIPSSLNINPSFAVSGYMFRTILHELGHGLGLAHPNDTAGESGVFPGVDTITPVEGKNIFHDANGNVDTIYDSTDYGNYDLNQNIYTAMSYNNGLKENGIEKFAPSMGSTYGNITTPMALDIAALQNIYKANTSFAKGNDTYTLPDTNAVGTGFECIWDKGGNDTIQYNGSGKSTIDLREATIDVNNQATIDAHTGGYISHVTDKWTPSITGVFHYESIAGGFTIAHGVEIENAKGGSGNDTLIGNNLINGLTGNGGKDTLIGGLNADVLSGRGSADTFKFNSVDDSGLTDTTRDRIIDFSHVQGDKIDLSGIDADITTKENDNSDAFFIFDQGINPLFTLPNSLYFDTFTKILYGNNDNDSMADFSIKLLDVATLNKTDFIL